MIDLLEERGLPKSLHTALLSSSSSRRVAHGADRDTIDCVVTASSWSFFNSDFLSQIPNLFVF